MALATGGAHRPAARAVPLTSQKLEMDQAMTFFKRAALSLGLGVVGYFVGLFGGIGLVYLLSSNQHDQSVEAAMTGAFVVGPLTALLFAAVCFVRTK